jgi:hypothetical protein
VRIEFEDTQDVKVLEDKLHKIRHILNTNLKICKEVGDLSVHNDLFQHPATVQPMPLGSATLHFVRELEEQLERVLTLKQRTEAVSDLVVLLCSRPLTDADTSIRCRKSLHSALLLRSRQVAQCLLR